MNKLIKSLIMKKITFVALFSLFCALSCQVNEPDVTESPSPGTIQVQMSASMPEFKVGGDPETKSSLESVVRVRWNAGDELSVINLTTGKQLGGCIKADNTGANTTFSPDNLTGTISAGDKLVFLLDNDPGRRSASEKTFESFSMDFSSQRGNAEDVPIVVYADYTATQDGTIDAVNPVFNFLMGYVQLAISALPASTSVTELGIENLNTACQFSIENNEFVHTPQNGNLTLTQAFNANSKGANTRYFSCFTSPALGTARNSHIVANAESHITAWLKAALSAGYYYQSVATGFTNENVQFVDDTFKSYCISHYDLNGDGELSFAEAAAVTAYYPFTDDEKANIEAVFELPYFPAELGIPSFEGCVALERISLPGTLSSIPANEFKGCRSLGSIVIPDTVTSIGAGAFEGCTSLQYFNSSMATTDKQFLVSGERLLAFAPANHYYIKIPNGVQIINEGVFKNCSNIKSLQLSNTREIEANAFYGCTSLLSLNLVSTIESLGNSAFYGCENLHSVYSHNPVPPTLGTDVFNECSNDLKVFVSETVVDGYTATSWSVYDVRSRVWNKIFYTTSDGEPLTFPHEEMLYARSEVGGPEYVVISNPLVSNEYTDGRGVLTFFSDITDGLWNFWIDEEDPYTGRGFTSMLTRQERLTSVTFPDCLREYPSLRDCINLETVSIPESVIWDRFTDMFEGCSSLSSYSGAHVSDDGLFVIHDGILVKCVPDGPSEISIPTYIHTISNYAFGSCANLSKVTIMDNVTEIGLQAFRGCPVDAYYFTSAVPPILSGDPWTFWFSDTGKIYVPYSAVDTYKTAGANWEPFISRIVGY